MFTLLLLVFVVLNLIAWPTDYYYFEKQSIINTYFLWRSITMLIIGVLILGYQFVDFARKNIFSVTYFALLVIMIYSGFLFGSLITVNSPWFYLVFVLPLFTVPFSFRFSTRIVATSIIPLSFLLPFAYVNPESIEYRYFNVIMTLVFSTIIIGIVLGHWIYFLNRKNFYRDRSLKSTQQKLQQLADHDQLTGLLNRRKFHEHAENEMERCRRYDNHFSLLMVDLDHFKKVNDTYGHPTGDRVLETIGRLIEEETRFSDYAARYGGEEFCILLSETNISEAVESAERLRELISDQEFRSDENETFSVTCSIGVTEFNEDKESLKEIVKEADDALYKAKESGRNQVEKS